LSIPETGRLLEDSTHLINWGAYLPVGDWQIARSINRTVPGCFDSKLLTSYFNPLIPQAGSVDGDLHTLFFRSQRWHRRGMAVRGQYENLNFPWVRKGRLQSTLILNLQSLRYSIFVL
jgi:hypothetical protein